MAASQTSQGLSVPIERSAGTDRCGRWMIFFSRLRRHEFWPGWVFYLPLVPWLVVLAVRHRSAMAFTCANPGIPGGGGIVGESKHAILRGLAAAREDVLEAHLIGAGATPERRLERVVSCMAGSDRLGQFPVVLKPDTGERGYGVSVIRSREEALSYLRRMPRDVVLQEYHPGPAEVGVLWVREGPDRGRVASITLKEWPAVTGDGRRTLARLLVDDPRFRCQMRLFAERFGERFDEVLAEGETLRLATTGNHCRGAIFRDGWHLRTPELERRIDAIARSFRGEGGGELDIGRFDLRAPSLEHVRRAEALGIIELNGVTGESTNMYDPDRSVVWAWRVLLAQWREIYRLGAWRRARGARPIGLLRLLAMWRRERAARRREIALERACA